MLWVCAIQREGHFWGSQVLVANCLFLKHIIVYFLDVGMVWFFFITKNIGLKRWGKAGQLVDFEELLCSWARFIWPGKGCAAGDYWNTENTKRECVLKYKPSAVVGSKAAGFHWLGYPGTPSLAYCMARLAQYQTVMKLRNPQEPVNCFHSFSFLSGSLVGSVSCDYKSCKELNTYFVVSRS